MLTEESLMTDLETAEPSAEAEARIDGVMERYRQYVSPGLTKLMQFAGFADVEVSAEGCVITTASGKNYLDFVGGFGVFTVGHRHPKVVEAVHQQLDRMPLATRTFFNEAQSLLAEKLAELAPGDLQYTFFSNSGTEAVEAALKFARAATGKPEFISTIGGYHGKTMGALAVTGREKYRKRFEPMLPTTLFTPYNDLPAIANAISERTAAVIIEPLQGEGGIVVPDNGYLSGLRQLCTERGVLLIVDEVQTGLGRTGKMFASEHESVVPDIMCLAKALGGGVMPIGATMTNATLWDCIFGENPLLHTSTFGGNPLACAAGYATLNVLLDENMAENALERGEQMLIGLRDIQKKHPSILKEARGKGLMLGVEFHIQDYAEIVINLMVGRGIIAAYTLNNPTVIRIEPPLIVSEAQCAFFLEALEGAVTDATELMEGMEA